MYLEHFGLDDEPFRLDPEGEYLYLSENHRRARTFMEYSLFREGGFVVVTGDIGTGKTTLVEHFLAGLPEDVAIARLARTRLEPAELLQTLMSRFGMEPFEGSRVAFIDAITDHLEGLYRRGRTALLVVDEAQALGRDALEELRLLTEFGGGRGRRLHVLLVGQPELGDLLDGPGMDQFLQRVRLRMHLRPLTGDEMVEYINHRLAVAGATEALFDDVACERILEYSGGVPRLVNVLCDTALMLAYGEGRRYPGIDSVDEAIAELGWRPFTDRPRGLAPVGGTEGAIRDVAGQLEDGLGDLREELAATRAQLAELTEVVRALAHPGSGPPPELDQLVEQGEVEKPEQTGEGASGHGWFALSRRRESS
ncbi:Type II secretory pathway, component ExeA (predicted ATPase) [Thiohalospira halophila DSM 15071]|uniref:Type II secretory pathway, component ExeA (Predicted ATPase) n=1 Tax=Thiohalospira halophila DSM 15071 TaxID=1123397 RepID=A0A1I1NKP6_9GAMM|nr:AAA family ATPase [Thiohalospira halophila]SFC98097.1 Type II secretory pathway, component ExeA (predicted ATPase) [Thiohalospira halophila DSM 15071]